MPSTPQRRVTPDRRTLADRRQSMRQTAERRQQRRRAEGRHRIGVLEAGILFGLGLGALMAVNNVFAEPDRGPDASIEERARR